MTRVLAIDMGSTCCKCALVKTSGRIERLATVRYSDQGVEDPRAWWEAVQAGIQQVCQKTRPRLERPSPLLRGT